MRIAVGADGGVASRATRWGAIEVFLGTGGVARKETRGEARERAWGGSQLWREPRGELEGACGFKESREEGSGGQAALG